MRCNFVIPVVPQGISDIHPSEGHGEAEVTRGATGCKPPSCWGYLPHFGISSPNKTGVCNEASAIGGAGQATGPLV